MLSLFLRTSTLSTGSPTPPFPPPNSSPVLQIIRYLPSCFLDHSSLPFFFPSLTCLCKTDSFFPFLPFFAYSFDARQEVHSRFLFGQDESGTPISYRPLFFSFSFPSAKAYNIAKEKNSHRDSPLHSSPMFQCNSIFAPQMTPHSVRLFRRATTFGHTLICMRTPPSALVEEFLRDCPLFFFSFFFAPDFRKRITASLPGTPPLLLPVVCTLSFSAPALSLAILGIRRIPPFFFFLSRCLFALLAAKTLRSSSRFFFPLHFFFGRNNFFRP